MQRWPETTQVVVTWTSALTRRRSPRPRGGNLLGGSDITTLGFRPPREAIGIVETSSELFPVVAASVRCREDGLDPGSPAAGSAQKRKASEPTPIRALGCAIASPAM